MVATTATKEEVETAWSIFIPKKISITEIIFAAPDDPPKFEIATIKNIKMIPQTSILRFLNNLKF